MASLVRGLGGLHGSDLFCKRPRHRYSPDNGGGLPETARAERLGGTMWEFPKFRGLNMTRKQYGSYYKGIQEMDPQFIETAVQLQFLSGSAPNLLYINPKPL